MTETAQEIRNVAGFSSDLFAPLQFQHYQAVQCLQAPPSPRGIGDCLELCSRDSDCPGDDQICCFNGCGHVCMTQTIVKPGKCPDDFFVHRCRSYCGNDGDCRGEMKCCYSMCGSECKYPEWRGENTEKNKMITGDNSGVTKTESLRNHSQLYHCVSSVTVSPESLRLQELRPAAGGHLVESRNLWVRNTGFCVVLSSNSIMPKSGNCPKDVPIMRPLIPLLPCDFDNDCPEYEKCCLFNRQRTCVSPVPTTPRCPVIPGVMPICGEMCSSDSDCPFGEKCCDNGCGHICLSHELVKPGSCPIVLFSLRCFDHCRGDSSCSNELKCCPTICGFKCVEPIF
nr:WAP four-disulfide core domain protein 8-like [Nothobranchius furzeri]